MRDKETPPTHAGGRLLGVADAVSLQKDRVDVENLFGREYNIGLAQKEPYHKKVKIQAIFTKEICMVFVKNHADFSLK